MGLFGGFKAKFTRESSNKHKPQEVVCLRYHIHSEFDNQEVSVAIPKQVNNIKKNEVIQSKPKKKDRKALTKSAIYPENQTSPLPNPPPQKSLSLTNLNNEKSLQKQENGYADPITVSTTFNMPANGKSVAVSDTKFRRTTEEHNGVITEKVAVVTNDHLYTTDRDVTKEQHNQKVLTKVSTYDEDGALTNGAEYTSNAEMSYLKPFLAYESSAKESGLNDQSTLIFMTQHSSRSSSIDRNMETENINFTKNVQFSDTNKIQDNYDNTALDENFKFNFVSHKTTSDDEAEYFKINVVKHDLSRKYSYSEDEQSHEDEEEPRFTRMGYSSQAASIFFGEGDEPEVARPRRIQFREEDEDERRSSGADC